MNGLKYLNKFKRLCEDERELRNGLFRDACALLAISLMLWGLGMWLAIGKFIITE